MYAPSVVRRQPHMAYSVQPDHPILHPVLRLCGHKATSSRESLVRFSTPNSSRLQGSHPAMSAPMSPLGQIVESRYQKRASSDDNRARSALKEETGIFSRESETAFNQPHATEGHSAVETHLQSLLEEVLIQLLKLCSGERQRKVDALMESLHCDSCLRIGVVVETHNFCRKC